MGVRTERDGEGYEGEIGDMHPVNLLYCSANCPAFAMRAASGSRKAKRSGMSSVSALSCSTFSGAPVTSLASKDNSSTITGFTTASASSIGCTGDDIR